VLQTVTQYWLLCRPDHKKKILPSLCKTPRPDTPASNVLRPSADHLHHRQPFPLECHCPGWTQSQQQKNLCFCPCFC